MGADRQKIDGAFEASVVYFLANSRAFPIRCIHKLTPEIFDSPYAALFVDLLVKFWTKKNRVPGGLIESTNLVTQWYNRGKITKKVYVGTIDYLHETPWYGYRADEREVSQQFVEHLRDFLYWQITHKTLELQSDRKPISEIAQLIIEADALLLEKEDNATHAAGDDIATWVKLIKTSGVLERMPTGITAWDKFLDGGLPRGRLGIVIGPTGGGKSMTLSQMCASCVLRGQNAAYISLEVDKAEITTRVMAPIAGIPIDFVVKNPDGAAVYLEQTFRRVHSAPGNLFVEDFPEGITVSECLTSLDKRFLADAKKGMPRPDHFYFDYLDRFGGGTTRGTDGYTTGRDVTQTIRNYLKANQVWGWSACQSKRFLSKSDYREAGVDSAADSQHKVRISDIVINILFNKDGVNGDEIASKISKHRSGKSGQKTPYQPADFRYGIAFDSPDFVPIDLESLAYDPYFADLVILD